MAAHKRAAGGDVVEVGVDVVVVEVVAVAEGVAQLVVMRSGGKALPPPHTQIGR
jgi:hypothetical protein